jgi:hypothetical protein
MTDSPMPWYLPLPVPFFSRLRENMPFAISRRSIRRCRFGATNSRSCRHPSDRVLVSKAMVSVAGGISGEPPNLI